MSAKLKDVNPFLINIHCVAHRLALCTSQAAASVEYLKEYKDILTSLFYYFKKSSLRSSRLKEIEDVLQCPRLKVRFTKFDGLHSMMLCRLCIDLGMGLLHILRVNPVKTPKQWGYIRN